MSDTSKVRVVRRDFLKGGAAWAATALLGLPSVATAEPPPEIEKLRIAQGPFICYAPQMLAAELLRLEGFTEVDYVPVPPDYTLTTIVGAKRVDLSMFGPTIAVAAIDAGWPVVMLAGIHVGCWELFARDELSSVRELQGKRIAVIGLGATDHLFIASMLAYVGVHPVKEVKWIPTRSLAENMRLFLAGEADAFLGFPPQPQEMRMRKAGRVLVSTTLDRPWSQYFCCMASMHREFVERYPVATKRTVRALLKASDLCANEPERAARYLVARGYERRYDVAFEVLKSLFYARWRESSPEDTLRFHALRLYEVGMIKSTPNKLIAEGSDWRFLDELKRELKA